jgi:hypothetical protein
MNNRIQNYKWEDDSLSVQHANKDVLMLLSSSALGTPLAVPTFYKKDAIRIAKHFKLTSEDVE